MASKCAIFWLDWNFLSSTTPRCKYNSFKKITLQKIYNYALSYFSGITRTLWIELDKMKENVVLSHWNHQSKSKDFQDMPALVWIKPSHYNKKDRIVTLLNHNIAVIVDVIYDRLQSNRRSRRECCVYQARESLVKSIECLWRRGGTGYCRILWKW